MAHVEGCRNAIGLERCQAQCSHGGCHSAPNRTRVSVLNSRRQPANPAAAGVLASHAPIANNDN
eukprot:14741597-Alexandrium_andersonii.AAC.1